MTIEIVIEEIVLTGLAVPDVAGFRQAFVHRLTELAATVPPQSGTRALVRAPRIEAGPDLGARLADAVWAGIRGRSAR